MNFYTLLANGYANMLRTSNPMPTTPRTNIPLILTSKVIPYTSHRRSPENQHCQLRNYHRTSCRLQKCSDCIRSHWKCGEESEIMWFQENRREWWERLNFKNNRKRKHIGKGKASNWKQPKGQAQFSPKSNDWLAISLSWGGAWWR